jgi:arginine repressor
MNKTPSIELLLHEEEIKSQNPLVRKIEDIFVNKATLSSK